MLRLSERPDEIRDEVLLYGAIVRGFVLAAILALALMAAGGAP